VGARAHINPLHAQQNIYFTLSALTLPRSPGMGATQSTANAAAYSRSTVSRSKQKAAAAPPHALFDMDDATVRLVVAAELQEVHALRDDSNGTSDCAMARRIAVDQLLSCRAINQIEEMTEAEMVRAASPPPSASDACTVCVETITADKAWRAPCQHWCCSDCLEKMIRACLNDETLFPPRCCVVLPWEEVKALLPRDLATSFEQRKAELDTPAGERLYCAEPACSHFLGTSATRARSVVCSLCNSATARFMVPWMTISWITVCCIQLS
jgi:hypothetical protein